MKLYYAGFVPFDGSISVIFPDVPGCCTWGTDIEHAFAMANEALAGHLEALANDNDEIPTPSNYDEAWNKLQKIFAEMEVGPLPKETKLHPVSVPDLDMRTRQVAVSFRQYMLDMIDRKAKAAGMTRSGFLAAAAQAYNPV